MEKKHSFFMKDENNSDRIEGLVEAFYLGRFSAVMLIML